MWELRGDIIFAEPKILRADFDMVRAGIGSDTGDSVSMAWSIILYIYVSHEHGITSFAMLCTMQENAKINIQNIVSPSTGPLSPPQSDRLSLWFGDIRLTTASTPIYQQHRSQTQSYSLPHHGPLRRARPSGQLPRLPSEGQGAWPSHAARCSAAVSGNAIPVLRSLRSCEWVPVQWCNRGWFVSMRFRGMSLRAGLRRQTLHLPGSGHCSHFLVGFLH